MSIDPTREEWQAARERLPSVHLWGGEPARDAITEAALGPCPPEPQPKDWYAGVLVLSAVKFADRRSVVIYCDDPSRRDPYLLTPDEAEGMAAALIEHARYAREQGPTAGTPSGGDDSIKSREWVCPAPIDGGLDIYGLARRGSEGWNVLCQRPKGHSMPCASEDDE